MRKPSSMAMLSAALIALPALSQTGANPPPPPADKPPATVPQGGRGMPSEVPGAVQTVPSGGRGMNDANGATSTSGATDLVDVNSASESTLQSKLGLKADEAKAIVKYRQQHGALTSQAQLASIGGLSRQSVEKMKGRVQFGVQSPGAGVPGG